MSIVSDLSDNEVSEKQDDKDTDFRIEDCHDEIDSDDSYCDVSANKRDLKDPNDNQRESEGVHKNEGVRLIPPGGHRFDRKFVCIRYPGNVINAERAIETLGGITAISTAVDTPNRRLELRFRPDDCYGKPACGDRHNTTALLLRVRVKKSRVEKIQQTETKCNKVDSTVSNLSTAESTDEVCNKNSTDSLSVSKKPDDHSNPVKDSQDESAINNLVDQVQSCSVSTTEDTPSKSLSSDIVKDFQEISIGNDEGSSNLKKDITPTFDRNKCEDLSRDKDYQLPNLKILGRVDTEFRFINLCDFQYLPLTQTKDDPKKLECLYDLIYPTNIPHCSWLKNEVPYFLPPAAFSRMDTVQQYTPKTEVDSHPENIIGKNKKRKAHFTNYISFSKPDVPVNPPTGIETALKVKFVQNIHLEQIRRIFEERPIWSKNAIIYKTNFSIDRLKILLPSVAYYFTNGPWKIMWVKLGYDPRKDVSARKYQTLDYRLKAMHGLGSTVTRKRSYPQYSLPYKSAPVSKQKTTILSVEQSQGQSRKKEQKMSENAYIYREGMVPPSRQMYYQYCDVLVDEIQEMLAKLPDPLPGVKCDEKRGWLPSGFDAQCREIINKQVRAVLRKRMNIPDDHPTCLPRKRKSDIKLKLQRLKRKRPKKIEPVISEEPSSALKNEEEESDQVKTDVKTD